MEKTGKQIEENKLNAVNGGNIYIVKVVMELLNIMTLTASALSLS